MKQNNSTRFNYIYFLLSYPVIGVFAASTHGSPSYPDGFFMGAGLGMTRFEASIHNLTYAVNTTDSNINNAYRYSAMGNLSLGYNRIFKDNYYFGEELGLSIVGAQKISTSNNNENTTITTQNQNSVIEKTISINNALSTVTHVSKNTLIPMFDIKPGFFISPNLLFYGRVGAAYNQFKITSTSYFQSSGSLINSSNVDLGSANVTSTLVSSHKKTQIGLRTGLGFEYLITPQVGLGANYLYTSYHKLESQAHTMSNQVACDSYEGCSSNGNGQMKITNRASVSEQDIMLQLLYHFS